MTTTLHDDFFAEFPPVSKEEWLAQIAKDLKGKPLEELTWQLGKDWNVSPFVHADDFAVWPAPISAKPNEWEICEDIAAIDSVVANRQALEALEGGAEGLCFYFEKTPSSAVFEQCLGGVHLDFVGLHFAGPGVAENPGAILGHLERAAKEKNTPTQHLRGSLGYDPAASANIVDWRYLADLCAFGKEKFPQFKIATLSASADFQEKEMVTALLADLLRRGNLYLTKLAERGISATEAATALQFSMPVGKSYFLEIAKIRALKLLWLNVLNAWGAAPALPALEARFQTAAYTDDLYTNMVRATTMAMSAVLGGADRLCVLPYDAGREASATYGPAFARRIARNVQHLLKMESFLNQIPDPAAGSHYMENLTNQLAERAWAIFSQAR